MECNRISEKEFRESRFYQKYEGQRHSDVVLKRYYNVELTVHRFYRNIIPRSRYDGCPPCVPNQRLPKTGRARYHL